MGVSGLTAMWFGWFGLVVLFPLTAIVVVSTVWRRLLCEHHDRPKRKPPYASIAGFILGGWYGYLVVGTIVVLSNLVPFFNLANDPQITRRQRVADVFCVLVAILMAFAGRWLARAIARRIA